MTLNDLVKKIKETGYENPELTFAAGDGFLQPDYFLAHDNVCFVCLKEEEDCDDS